MRFFLMEEMTIIAAKDQEQAEILYRYEYEDDCKKVEEIEDDYVVAGIRNVNGLGYDEVFLYEVLENRLLPYVVDVELI